ncbi:hypothetical protein [Microvirga massiliensis]|uniref:hypothetical protein n=1 Tax=Microvirga massiliensis TaxID=1033741 RepID=UPI0012E16A60|nr:hypothetical protein [Microvirga massiliensis]
MPSHDEAADYRRRAQETRAVARLISLRDDRQPFLDEADRLDALAAIAEAQDRQRAGLALASRPHADPLLKRAEAALAETARLRDLHAKFLDQVEQQLAQMRQIGAELDALLPHPPDELRRLRAISGVEWPRNYGQF